MSNHSCLSAHRRSGKKTKPRVLKEFRHKKKKAINKISNDFLTSFNLMHYPKSEVIEGRKWLRGITLNLPDSQKRKIHNKYRRFRIYNEELRDSYGRVLIPQEEINQLLLSIWRDPARMKTSRDKLYEYIKSHYIGVTRKDCMDFLKSQTTYQRHAPQKKPKVRRPIITSQPLQRWQIDRIEVVLTSNYKVGFRNNANMSRRHNHGYRYIITIIDCFSKYAWAIPTKTKKAAEWLPKFKEILKDFGKPQILQGDNEFTDEELKNICSAEGIKLVNSFPYHPRANGMIEKFNQTLKALLFKLMEEHETKTWSELIEDAVMNYNNTIHSVTGFTPSKLHITTQSKNKSLAKSRITESGKKKINPTIAKRLPRIRIGDTVRISLEENNARNKLEKRFLPQWSKNLYTVISQDKPIYGQRTYKVQKSGDKPSERIFFRDMLLKVN